MNELHIRLWRNLSALVNANEAFYYKDFVRDELVYRVFNYRLASYTDFCQQDALECRGIMFEVSCEGRSAIPIRLASFPQEKFFNYMENPMTMNVDFSTLRNVMDKADGSLISTYNHNNTVGLKSKMALFSDQAVAAERFLNRNDRLAAALHRLVVDINLTVNMEYVAPDNRIVMAYPKPDLIILNVRDNETGEYVDKKTVLSFYGCECLEDFWVDTYDIYNDFGYDDPVDFVTNIKSTTNREGFVLDLGHQRLKIKTDWYLVQHRAKDSVNSPRRLFEAVLDEVTDDLRSLFHDNEPVLTAIDEMERIVESIYNPLVDTIERFYERNKHLERKDYAILGQETFSNRGEFGLAMGLYTNRPVSYKEFLKKNYKQYGIVDVNSEEE